MSKYSNTMDQLAWSRKELAKLQAIINVDDEIRDMVCMYIDPEVLNDVIAKINAANTAMRAICTSHSAKVDNAIFLASMGIDITNDYFGKNVVLENEMLVSNFISSDSLLDDTTRHHYKNTTVVKRPYGEIVYKSPLYDIFTIEHFYDEIADKTRGLYNEILQCMTDGYRDVALQNLYDKTNLRMKVYLTQINPMDHKSTKFNSIDIITPSGTLNYSISGSFYTFLNDVLYPSLRMNGHLDDTV